MTCHFKFPIASIPLCLAMMRSIPPYINYSIYLSEHCLITWHCLLVACGHTTPQLALIQYDDYNLILMLC